MCDHIFALVVGSRDGVIQLDLESAIDLVLRNSMTLFLEAQRVR
jgi:hypothetical protein